MADQHRDRPASPHIKTKMGKSQRRGVPEPISNAGPFITGPASLESLCLNAYLNYLEAECTSYVALTQAPGHLLGGLADRLLASLKVQLSQSMSGLASSVLRERMLDIVLDGERFPSPERCTRKALFREDPAATLALLGLSSHLGHSAHHPPTQASHAQTHALHALGATCISPCCSGAFVQEAMAAVLVNADVRRLIFTSEAAPAAACGTRRLQMLSAPGGGGATGCTAADLATDFNVGAVFNHLAQASIGQRSQLRRLVISENFVSEEEPLPVGGEDNNTSQHPLTAADPLVAILGDVGSGLGPGAATAGAAIRCRDIIFSRLRRSQSLFASEFGRLRGSGLDERSHYGASPTHPSATFIRADRGGVAQGLMSLFRHACPRPQQFSHLTELVLKNNVQCETYSRANFQFEFLARVGHSCPRLRVLDLFGTDTWADCLVAFFFRDAFHSLHRYLFFMENEEDECSAYHPHDLRRYCQFCLDQLHPRVIERPGTVNPVIPLLDDVHEHVRRKYPKRSYCILRNCVKVSDLIAAAESNVYELVRRDNMSDYVVNADELDDDMMEDPSSLLKTETEEEEPEDDEVTLSPNGRPTRKAALRATVNIGKVRKRVEAKESNYSGAVRRSARLRRRQKERKVAKKESDNKKKVQYEKNSQDDQASTSSQAGGVPFGVDSKELRVLLTPSRIHTPLALSATAMERKADVTATPAVMTRSRKRRLEEEAADSGKRTWARTKKAMSELGASVLASRRRSTRTSQGFSEGGNAVARHRGSLAALASPEEAQVAANQSEVLPFTDWELRLNKCYCVGEDKDRCPALSEQRGDQPEDSGHGPRRKCRSLQRWNYDADWVEPEFVQYRQISNWPHLNECLQTLEVLNLGGTNVLGEFIPFALLTCPKLKSLGQWINTVVYGLEILRKLPGRERARFPALEEFSYSTDRNYFCQPYIGFVPESSEYRNVRREMVRFSGKLAGVRSARTSGRNKREARKTVANDVALVADACPNLRKLNLVVHFKTDDTMDEDDEGQNEEEDQQGQSDEAGAVAGSLPKPTSWDALANLKHLTELDLVTMRFSNVKSLLRRVGPQLTQVSLYQ